jgi:hypothetical protein
MPRPPSWSTQPRRGRRVSAKRPLIAAIKRGAPRLRPHGLRDDATRHAGRVDVGPDDTPRGHRRGRGPGRGSARCTGLPSAASTTGAACPSDGPCSGPSSRIGHRSTSSRVSAPPDCEVPSSGSHCECHLVRAVARTRGCTACVVACEGGPRRGAAHAQRSGRAVEAVRRGISSAMWGRDPSELWEGTVQTRTGGSWRGRARTERCGGRRALGGRRAMRGQRPEPR